MSLHELYFFPRHFHAARPDWALLERRLLGEEIILPPFGKNIARQDLHDLVSRLAPTGFMPWDALDAVASAHELVAMYKAHGALPNYIITEPDMGMSDVLASLRLQGAAMDESWLEEVTRFRLGPGARALFPSEEAWAEHRGELALTLWQFEERIHVTAGENLELPLSPSSGLPLQELPPFGSHIDFIGAVFDDPGTTWTDPATGQAHHILDLDWRQTLGMGWRTIRLEFGRAPGQGPFYQRFTERLSDMVGVPMVMAHLHL